jgi:hypothetical protein
MGRLFLKRSKERKMRKGKIIVAMALATAAVLSLGMSAARPEPAATAPLPCRVSASTGVGYQHNEWGTLFDFYGIVTLSDVPFGGVESPCPGPDAEHDSMRTEVWLYGMENEPSCEMTSPPGVCWKVVDPAHMGREETGGNYQHPRRASGNWTAESHAVFWDNEGPSYMDSSTHGINLGLDPAAECEASGGHWVPELELCEYNPDPGSPILIPLGGNQAFKLTSVGQGVAFDLNADGAREQTAWTAADSKLAFLALDRNGNGIIDNGSELFGNHTLPGVTNGFRALELIEPAPAPEPQGFVDHTWSIYSKLLLWEDRNHNGFSEPEELQPASNLVVMIGLGYSIENRRDGHGNQFRWRGWATLRTAPGINKPRNGTEARERQFAIFDVIFSSGK